MLDSLLEIGFFEIEANLNPGIRKFRLYENYKDVQLRIIVTLENGLYEVENIFFYSGNSKELQDELFGTEITVVEVIKAIKNLHKSSKPFNNSTETG